MGHFLPSASQVAVSSRSEAAMDGIPIICDADATNSVTMRHVSSLQQSNVLTSMVFIEGWCSTTRGEVLREL